MTIHPGSLSALGLALAGLGLVLQSPVVTVGGLGLAAAVLVAMTRTQSDPLWSRWCAWAELRGLADDCEDDGTPSLRGARRGQPVIVRFEEGRVHASCRIESPVERSFPPSAPRILSHIKEANELRLIPTPTLRDPELREAWRRVLEQGHNVRVVHDEVRLTLVREELQTHDLDQALNDVAELAERMLVLRSCPMQTEEERPAPAMIWAA